MNFNKSVLPIIGAMMVIAALLVGCGPSKEQSQLAAQNAAYAKANATFAEVRQAATGDKADESAKKLVADLKSAGYDLTLISVKSVELQKTVADKYFADAQGAFKTLRDPKTGPVAADTARKELYRTLQASGRNLGDLHLTARGIDALVAQANHRNEIRNSPQTAAANHKAVPKKAPVKKPHATRWGNRGQSRRG